MTALLVLWCVLGLVCLVSGLGGLALFRADLTLRRMGDRALMALWIGLAVLLISVLSLSLVGAVRCETLLLLGIGLSCASLLQRRCREWLRQIVSCAPMLGLLVLGVGVGLFSAQRVINYDTGLYHYGAIRWMATHGAVPGLALLHYRFGFVSSWFALSAPFDAGFMRARGVTVASGFVLIVCLLHAAVSARRVWRGNDTVADRFALAAFSFLVLLAMLFEPLPVSPSPNFALAPLTVAACWSVLALVWSTGQSTYTERRMELLLPVVLGAAASSVKINGLPVLLAACLPYALIHSARSRWHRALEVAFLVSICLLPVIGVHVVISGCGLFPVPATCFNLPWGVESQMVNAILASVQDWARWSGPAPIDASVLKWVWRWTAVGSAPKGAFLGGCLLGVAAGGVACLPEADRRRLLRKCWWVLAPASAFTVWMSSAAEWSAIVMAGTAVAVWALVALPPRFFPTRIEAHPRWPIYYIIAGMTGVLYLIVSRAPNVLVIFVVSSALAQVRPLGAAKAWLMFTGLLGIATTALAAPDLHYMVGYLCVLMAVPLARAIRAGIATLRSAPIPKPFSLSRSLAILGIIFGLSRVPLVRVPSFPYFVLQSFDPITILVPPALPLPFTVERRSSRGILYVAPVTGDQCWAARQPCTPESIGARVYAVKITEGVGGGLASR